MINVIRLRRSVRRYDAEPIEKQKIEEILLAGTFAPSGKNGQPWRFAVVQNDKKLLHKIAECTVYKFVSTADCLICVFMDKSESYHYIKDCQAIGASIQNMLLTAEELNLGACWIGEILNRDAEVKKLLNLDNRYDLMAVIALGKPLRGRSKVSARKTVQECTLLSM